LEGRDPDLSTDRICMRTSLICLQILILSKRQGRGTSRRWKRVLVPRDKPLELESIIRARASCHVTICNGGGHMVNMVVVV
jgi:hypothetical protein